MREGRKEMREGRNEGNERREEGNERRKEGNERRKEGNERRKEGNVLFNDAYNTFYLWLYGVGHMVKDRTDSERRNSLLPLQGLLFQISSKGSFMYVHHPTDRITHTTAFVTPVLKHWPVREIAQWVHPMKDRSDDPSHHERTLLPRSYISLLFRECTYSAVLKYFPM